MKLYGLALDTVNEVSTASDLCHVRLRADGPVWAIVAEGQGRRSTALLRGQESQPNFPPSCELSRQPPRLSCVSHDARADGNAPNAPSLLRSCRLSRA